MMNASFSSSAASWNERRTKLMSCTVAPVAARGRDCSGTFSDESAPESPLEEEEELPDRLPKPTGIESVLSRSAPVTGSTSSSAFLF
jgi:hypothetical protein